MTSQAQRRASTIAAIVSAASELFTSRGFAATSIDDIASRAGVAKGAVYHHFESKDQIFQRVFEQMTGALAAEVSATAAAGTSILDRFERGTLKYLTSIAGNKFRQVLLIDGPAVLGWEKWREIDTRSFGGVMRGAGGADAARTLIGARDGSDRAPDRRCAQQGRQRSLRDLRPSRARRARLHCSAAQDARAILSHERTNPAPC